MAAALSTKWLPSGCNDAAVRFCCDWRRDRRNAATDTSLFFISAPAAANPVVLLRLCRYKGVLAMALRLRDARWRQQEHFIHVFVV